MIFRNIPQYTNRHFFLLGLSLICFAACNEGSMEAGKGGKEEKDQVDISKELNASNSAQTPITDSDVKVEGDDETKIATQPASVSGAFLTTKVIKVENQKVQMGAAVYVDGVLQHDVKAYGAAGGMNMVWTPGGGVLKYIAIPKDLQEQYTAIFDLKYEDYEALNLSVVFLTYDISEDKASSTFPLRTDGDCGDACLMVCDNETIFHNLSSSNSEKFKIVDSSAVKTTFGRISDCEYTASSGNPVIDSLKTDTKISSYDATGKNIGDPLPISVIKNPAGEGYITKNANEVGLGMLQGHISFDTLRGSCSGTEPGVVDRIIEYKIKAIRRVEAGASGSATQCPESL